MSLSEIAIRNIQVEHARQLGLLGGTLYDSEPPETDMPPDYLQSVLDMVKANPNAVAAAQAAQCTSPSTDNPNWNTVFFGLVESAAVYLRKETEIIAAMNAASEGDFDRAVKHIQNSQETINEVAKAIDCTFVQLCDFSHQGPEGTWFHSGAFCGLFVSNNTTKPYMGLTYKGTTISNFREVTTDLDYSLVDPLVPGAAWGARLHRGFNYGLFGVFSNSGQGPQIAYDVMFNNLSTAYDDHGGNAMLHFTGHSLGGAYCTLTYGEFLRRQNEIDYAKFKFGDMYSLAAPRVATEPFRTYVKEYTPPGQGRYLFRIANNEDAIPTVPPRTKSQFVTYPYLHVGGAWKLFDTGAQKMDDEPPPADPLPIVSQFWKLKHHQITDYYANWLHTPHA